LYGIAAFVLLVCGSFYFLLLRPISSIPSLNQVRSDYAKSEGVLLDRYGEVIHELRIDKQGRRLDWVPLSGISPALQSAIISGEDRRFYAHCGVDWLSFGSALLNMGRATGTRGASTITMQLAAQLDEKLQPEKNRRSLIQKSRQIRAARTLEKSWSKPEILEAYLNLITFRGELQGVVAASRGLFGKEPQGLNNLESMILAALVRSPNAGIQAIASRARMLARTMASAASVSEIDAKTTDTLLRPYFVKPRAVLAPHVALRLFAEASGAARNAPERISCSLDGRLQAFASEALQHHILSVRSQNVRDGAALVVDNRSGDVLAYAGNVGDQSGARYVDGVRALRQAGSTLKPFVYALAFERRLLTPVSLIEDSPLDIPLPGGVYRPKNYDNRFHGFVTARIALASSLNVPAVKTLNLIGVDSFVEKLREFGFDRLESPDYYGPSLALGSADVTLWDLVNAYRALANGGLWSPLRLREDTTDARPDRVLSAGAAFLVADILSDRESRSRTFALESPLSTRFWTAVKTGTSKDMRDNWCIGFSDRYTVGVWAGNFSGESMWNVSGITGAAPVWIEIMNYLHRHQNSRKPAPPNDLVQRNIKSSDPVQTGQEWFLKGTDAAAVIKADNPLIARILYPAPGTILALDPDIPPENQKMFFEAAPGEGPVEWILDGRSLGFDRRSMPWAPEPGKHVIRLLDGDRRELDSVGFEVRGNVSGGG
jgi:penicillin-binding protein 1C